MDSISDLPLPPPPEVLPLPEDTSGAVVEEPAVEVLTTEIEVGYSREGDDASAASVNRYETKKQSFDPILISSWFIC